MVRNLRNKFFIVVAVVTFALPAGFAWAQQLVPSTCSNSSCRLEDLSLLINNIINYAVIITIPLAAVGFAWGGYQLMFSQGDMGKIQSGRKSLLGTLLGVLLVFTSWLIVKLLVVEVLGVDHTSNRLK